MVDIRGFKYFLYLLISGAIVGGVLLWGPFSGYYHVFPVTYSKYDHPFITTTLEGDPCKLGIDIGCRFPLFMRQAVLDSINKQFQGTEICRNIDGSQQETPYYLIPKLKVGDLILKDVFAYQSDNENYDTLGKFLGGEFNLLLDFPSDRIIACDNFSKLQTKGIADKNWIQLPFEVHRIGIVLNVDTDFGTRKLVLNTKSMYSVLSFSAFPANARLPYVSSSFVLGGHQFSNVTFEHIELPEALNEIDGFIGMDYLKEHAIYLDYANKTAHIAPSHRYFTRIPVSFSKQNDPIIDVLLENDIYSLKLDLGSPFSFSLGKEILQKINKSKYGTSNWHDFKGNQYESPIYTIPEVKIGDLKFSRVFVNHDSEEFHSNTTLIGDPLQLSGVIGLPILQKYNLLLDFPHSAIYASKDLSTLQQKGLFSDHFLAVPFAFHPDGIILTVETDAGVYRLVLDTGTTTTAIRIPHPCSTEKFRIMGYDFGKCFVMPLDFSPRFDFDGCIGMDFLRERLLFIDYSNKMIYIDLQKEDQDRLNVLIKHGKDGRPGQNGENGQNGGMGVREVIVIGGVEAMGVTEETLISAPSIQIYAGDLCFGELEP